MADVKGFLRKVFPFISAAASLGGPAGTMAANALGAALGATVEPTEKGITDALSKAAASPDQLLAAQKAEQDFQVQMAKLGYEHVEDLEKVAADDRASARAREVSVKDKIPAILAITITVGFFALLGAMLKWSPPASNKDLLNIMLGSLGTAWVAVVTYYFGSSAGSARKDDILAGKTNQ